MAEPVRVLPPDDDGDAPSPDSLELKRALRLAAIREHGLRSLAELGQNLGASPDLFHLADLALFNLMGHYGTSKSALWMRSETQTSAPVLVRAHGIDADAARALGPVAADRVLRERNGEAEPLTVEDVSELAGETAGSLMMRSGIALLAPIPTRGETLGLVGLGKRIGVLSYGAVEFQSLQAALSVLGVAIQNRTLLGRLVENNRQLRRANEDLADINRIKSEFMSNVNHELVTPLAIIIGYVEALLGSSSLTERERNGLETVVREAKSLYGMLRNLLTFSEASHGVLTLDLEEGNAAPCVVRYCEERRAGASARLRELVWSIDEDLPPARFDAKRLTQVVDALVDNGIKFAPEGSRIEVRVHTVDDFHGSWVAIDVADNGPGIDEDRMSLLFESFRQGDGSATRMVGGLGIGLSFSRQLVTAMGGRIQVDSEPGKGARFTVLLPRV